MDLGLDGRIVVVTGGNRGIGKAISIAVAREGANVAVLSRDAETGNAVAKELHGGNGFFVQCDVSAVGKVGEAVDAVLQRYGRLDAVINNAGRFGGGPIMKLDAAALREGLDTKIVGPLALVRAALPALRQSDQARIVNISGVTAHRIMPGAAVTAIANSGMVTMSGYLATELLPDGINVNCILPGYILTGPWRARVQALADAEGLDFDAAKDLLLKRQDMGHARWGTEEDIADVVLFLLSAQARFVNGASFRLDGGQFLGLQK
jgi:NAD(P)-dependent dehydrogenase (short-subunit alcohol dehydrogenase family)